MEVDREWGHAGLVYYRPNTLPPMLPLLLSPVLLVAAAVLLGFQARLLHSREERGWEALPCTWSCS